MRRYAQWTGIDLCFQSFTTELDELPGKYVAPLGAFWLARVDASHNPVGIIAVRPIDDAVCEMKRLWVEPELRDWAWAANSLAPLSSLRVLRDLQK